MDRTSISRATVIAAAALVTALFMEMLRPFFMSIVLAGIFSAMAQPLYRRMEKSLGGRSSLASILTLTLLTLVFIIPLTALLGIFAAQAMKIAHSARALMERTMGQQGSCLDLMGALPLSGILEEYGDVILQRAGDLASRAGSIIVDKVSSITVFTIQSVFMFFVFLYTMFFFLKDGRRILDRFLAFLPMPEGMEKRLLDKFTSVARATLKGVLLIGLLQGGLAGLAFWMVGIEGPVFWGAIMALLSIIPAVGSALVWAPAAIILALSGDYLRAAFLLVFCGMIVGSVDNLLRPWLVGRDTRMHELMIFFGTLGGLGMFGVTGFILGPVIAALFITVWDIYAENFSEYLPGRACTDMEDPPGGKAT
jgi:predicted PurR-regulated permease PerM